MNAETILSLIADRARSSPGVPAIFQRAGASWHPMTLRGLVDSSTRLGDSLGRHGLKRGDRLAILCRTRVEWIVAELAAMSAGIVVVGIDIHASNEQVGQILEESKCAALIVDSASALVRVPVPVRNWLSMVIAIDAGNAGDDPQISGIRRWADLVAPLPDNTSPPGAKNDASTIAEALHCWHGAEAQSTATLLYTSGTTGRPRAIRYRQEQLAIACRSILTEFPSVAASGGTTICWLPMAALFQRMMNYVALAAGVAIYFVDDPAGVVDVARAVQPTYFIGVPRFFEKLYQGIERELASRPAWLRNHVARSLTGGSGQRARGSPAPRRRLLDRIILRRLRGVLGSRLRFVITGSAPAPVWLLEYFERLGILVLEAYGLSENAVPVAANSPHAYRFGSVGRVFRANEVRIAEDGEILVRGPGVFDGYLTVGEAVTVPLTMDGYFPTGDLGRLDADGYLFLEGRKSEVFKTSNGRRITPSQIEAVYKQIPYVDQIVVVGHGRPFPVALLAVNRQLLNATARAGGGTTAADRVPSNADAPARQFMERLAADMDLVGSKLAPYERIRRFELLEQPFTPEGGEITPSLKLRRDVIERKYRDLIARIYSMPA